MRRERMSSRSSAPWWVTACTASASCSGRAPESGDASFGSAWARRRPRPRSAPWRARVGSSSPGGALAPSERQPGPSSTGAAEPRSRAARSTASRAMTRYVVYLPPAIAVRPGTRREEPVLAREPRGVGGSVGGDERAEPCMRPRARVDRRGPRRQAGSSSPSSTASARRRTILATNTSTLPGRRDGDGDRPPRPGVRHPLLQPRAGDVAGRDRAARSPRPTRRSPRRATFVDGVRQDRGRR